MFNWIRTAWVVSTIGFLAACSGDDDREPTVAETTASGARFSILSEALAAADLTATFQSPGNYTVFAPTNDAFAALLTELGLTKAALLGNKPLLTAVLKHHVLSSRVARRALRRAVGQGHQPARGRHLQDRCRRRGFRHHRRTQPPQHHHGHGRVLKADVPVGAAITTLQGETFSIDASLTITDRRARRARRAGITATDVLASNGVIHVVDKVLLPAP